MISIVKFFSGFNIKLMMILGVVGFLVYFARDVYVDYQHTIEQNTELTETVAELRSANAVNEATLDAIKKQNRENLANKQALDLSLKQIKDRNNKLEEILAEHNLEFLALKKPELIQRRINDATYSVFRSIECSTGGLCAEANNDN